MSIHSKRSTDSMKESYHGLVNQGSTCYLNSVLQVLFMTTEFRDAVIRYAAEHEDTSRIDKQLSALFYSLRRHAGTTVDITRKLGIHNVNKQSDAAQHLEKILTLSSKEASQIFNGKLLHRTTCLTCNDVTDATERFWFLPLTLDDNCSETFSVRDGIEDFFKKSVLSGDNQLYCERCDQKSDANIVCEIEYHPEVLILLLKRFQFSYQFRSFVKKRSPVDVPCSLNISKDQIYDLYGFVEHYGNLKSGHYTSTVKSQNDNDSRWYNFNDSSVTQLNRNQSLMDDNKNYPTNSQSVYVLFYRQRKYTIDNRTPSRNVSTHVSNDQHLDVTKSNGSHGGADDHEGDAVTCSFTDPLPISVHTETLDNGSPGKQRNLSSHDKKTAEFNVPAAPDVKTEINSDREEELLEDKQVKNRKPLQTDTGVSEDQRAHLDVITESRADKRDQMKEAEIKPENGENKGQGVEEKQKKNKGAANKVVPKSADRSSRCSKTSHGSISRDTTKNSSIRKESVQAIESETQGEKKEKKKKKTFLTMVKHRFTRKDQKKKAKAKVKEVKQRKNRGMFSRLSCLVSED